MFDRFRENIAAFMARDPAARGALEIVLCYPGFHALIIFRLTHWLWGHNIHLLARFISHIAKILTGVDIHPAAEIGRRFVIDHGTGVVIGETAIIGDDVTLYHAVTLGGTAPSVDSDKQVGQKRHPTLMDGVIIGSGAQVLGPITIGESARIGANSVVTKDIPAGVTAVGIPAKVIVPRDKTKAKEFQPYGTPADGPDPLQQMIDSLRGQVSNLIERVEDLETEIEQSRTAPTSKHGGKAG